MAELEEALYSRLTTHGGLSALVSSRVYPVILPQKPTLPAVTYQRLDGDRESGMTQEHAMAHPRMRVTSWATTYAAVKAVATQVRTALQRWAAVAAGVTVLDSFIEGDSDGYDADVDLFYVGMEFVMWHRE